MRRSSYLSRIARAGTEDRPSLAPVRVLFRPPPPIPDGLRAEAPAIFPTEVTLVESRSGGNPSELTRNLTAPSKPLVPSRDAGANSALSSSAKPGQGVSANVEPRVVSAKLDRHSKVLTRSSNEVVATFDRSSLDMEVSRPISQHRSANANDSTLVQTTFSAAPVSKRASETPPTLLIPPPPAPREPFAQAPTGAEKRAKVNMETGSGLRIGALEVRIVPPPPVTPPAPAAFLGQRGASRPQVALSRGFRSFGLTQS